MKFWKAQLRNGEWISEKETSWDKIKDNIINLEFHNNDQIISLPKNAESYIQGKTACGNLSTGECVIESRYIGFFKNGVRIITRINEKNNKISLEAI